MLKNIWINYKRYIKVSSAESKLALILGIIGALSETFSIYLLANLITNLDKKILNINLKFLNQINFSKEIYILFFLISAILSASLYFLSNKNIVKAKCLIEKFVREEITDLTLNIKWEYYLKMSQGDISKSLLSEGQNISEGYMYFISAITYSFIAFTYFLACLILVPDTFFILIIYAIFAFRIYLFYSRKADKFGKDLSNITSNIGNWTSSIFNNLKYLKAISKDKLAKQAASEIFIKFADSYKNARVASYKSKLITEVMTIIFIFLAITFILLRGANTSNLILSLSLFIRMTPKIYNAQIRLLDSIAMVSWPKVHNERINWAKTYKDTNYNNKNDFSFDGEIIFDSVFFNYPNCNYILNDINLIINKNDCIGIIGKSGIGKSTLLDLITGLIKPKKGSIYISGKNINNININSWRGKLGIVMQENFFKNDTISSNIALDKKIDRKKIKESLIKANAWDFVSLLPNGIDEMILDRGLRLSGGERQRIALARALYNEPQVLILDEPSTGLDKYSEKKLISSIKKLVGSINIIIISHKRELVAICDKVLTLDNKGLNKK